jgi:acetyl-CoA carboxylase biotin carboxyl carrier protein
MREEILTLLDGVLSRMVGDVSVIQIETGDTKLRVERGAAAPISTPVSVAAVTLQAPETVVAETKPKDVFKSPIVGTFYMAPGPDAPLFVEAGQKVKKGDTLCIIEAMKMMNEIEAEHEGVIARVLAENGALVEFGQPLFEWEVL